MSRDESTYRPIACALHDELEAAATRRAPVALAYTSEEGEEREARGRIVDLGARNGAEYLRLDTGLELRLDRIRALDGVPFRNHGR